MKRPFAFRYAVSLLGLLLFACLCEPVLGAEPRKPNIVFIIADDLGYGDLGCFGQKKIRTPNIDRMAAEGIRFTQHYSGNAVCAPSRCVLMTGQHPGHAFIRDNKEVGEWDSYQGQLPLPENQATIAKALKKLGYATGRLASGALAAWAVPATR